jgi:hypothetical protein
MEFGSPLYQPLNSDKHEIRLLSFSTSHSTTGTIYCVFKTVSLDSAPEYYALSYEWGERAARKGYLRVVVNSHELHPTTNLVLALLHILPFGNEQTLYWIDALCINQNDLSERAQQVLLMREIYQQATFVYVWLGIEKGNSHLGMELIHEFGAELDDGHPLDDEIEEWTRQKLADPKYQAHWDGLLELLQRSYWKRIWIIQEIVVARSLVMQCDLRRTKLLPLLALARQIMRISSSKSCLAVVRKLEIAAMPVLVLGGHIVFARPKDNSCEYNNGLLRLLIFYSGSLCSDPRDRVYALLGIALPYQGLELKVDYSISVAKVYTNAAQYIIRGSGRLDILLHCGRDNNPLCCIPSWVPDWRLPFQGGHAIWNGYGSNYTASGSSSAIATFSSDGNLLTARAILLGSIESFIPCEYQGPITSAEGQLKVWLQFAISSLQKGQQNSEFSASYSVEPAEATFRAARALYEALFYTVFGSEDTLSRWPFEEFLAFCLAIRVIANDNQKLSRNKIVMLQQGDQKGRNLISLSIPHLVSDVNTQTTVGICLAHMRIGDIVTILYGCNSPILLRPRGDHFELICDIYVHGFMHGEVMGKLPEINVSLV